MGQDIEVCAGGVVIKDGKVVVLKRKNGVWLMPKGHVDPGETIEEAASREVEEETGLQVRVFDKLGETSYSYWENGHFHKKIVHWFFMKAIGGELVPEKGMFIDIKLISEHEIDTLSFEHDRELASKAFASLEE